MIFLSLFQCAASSGRAGPFVSSNKSNLINFHLQRAIMLFNFHSTLIAEPLFGMPALLYMSVTKYCINCKNNFNIMFTVKAKQVGPKANSHKTHYLLFVHYF